MTRYEPATQYQLPPASVILAVTIVALAARPLLAMALRLARWTPYDAPT